MLSPRNTTDKQRRSFVMATAILNTPIPDSQYLEVILAGLFVLNADYL